MEHALAALRAQGVGFAMTLTTSTDRLVEAEGQAIGGRAVLRLRNMSGVRHELGDLMMRYQRHIEETEALHTLVEHHDVAGVGAGRHRPAHLRECRLCAPSRRADLPMRSSAIWSCSTARPAPRCCAPRRACGRWSAAFPPWSPACGAASTCVTCRRRRQRRHRASTRPKSRRMRGRDRAHRSRRTARPSTSSPPRWRSSAPTASSPSTTPPIARCGSSMPPSSTRSRPTTRCSTACGRRARLPEQPDFRRGRRQLHEAYRAARAEEHRWHLPDGRTLRVVTTPKPGGGVTYLFEDVTERLDLERRYNALIRVQGETLDNLAEAVAVFGQRRKGAPVQPAFAQMWRPAPEMLDQRPHIEAVIALVPCAPATEACGRRCGPPSPPSRTAMPTDAAHRAARRQRGRLSPPCRYPTAATLVTFHDVTDSVNVERALRREATRR